MTHCTLLAVIALAGCALSCRAFGEEAPSSKSNASTVEWEEPPDEPAEEAGGDPVGYVSGNVYDAETDIRIPCPDIDLVFRRSYNSATMRSGALGHGWTHSYEWRVVETNGTVLVYASGEGGSTDAVHRFRDPGADGWTFNADGYGLRKTGGGLFRLVTPEARTYSFNEAGLLSSISAWNGTKVTLDRPFPNFPARRAVHSNGKWLEFSLGGAAGTGYVTTSDPSVWVELETEGYGEYMTLRSVARHDGDSVSRVVYSYTDLPPGRRAIASETLSHYGGGAGGGALAIAAHPARPIDRFAGRPVLSGRTDANGVSANYVYVRPDDSPTVRCTFMSMDGGLFETSFSYGEGFTAERKPIAGGVAETVVRHDNRRRETERRTGSEVRYRAYDAPGDLVAERLEETNTGVFVEQAMSYDARRRLSSVGTAYCAAPTRFTRLSWDDRRGIPRRVVSPEGRVREWTTNGHDVVVHGAGTNDARAVTAILCDANDRPYAIVSPDGGRTDLVYDAGGYLSRIAEEDLPPVEMAHDALGRVSSMTLPGPSGDRVTSFTRNWRGKPLSVAYPDGTAESYAYNGNGTRVTRHVDALGREDAYQWTLGLPIHAGRVVDGVTNTLFRVEHDEQLNVVAIIDPLGRNAETYVLDENERVVAVTNVEGQVLTRTYAVGKMIASETRFDGSVVSYAYDADGNLATVAYPDETLAFTYDGDGLRTSASNSVGVVTNEYDAATGWLASSRGADGTTVSYAYSDGGEATGVVSVAGTTRYALDKASRRTRIDSPAGTVRLGYCEWNGKVSAVTNANGMVTAYAYDVMDRVTNIAWTAANGISLGGFTYEYDAAGRIVSRTHSLGGATFDRTYAYDDLDRLAADGDTVYTYDAAGSRMTRTENGEAITYTLGIGDRLASWTGGTYTHNAAGCVTRIERDCRPTLDLAWNDQYQLVSVSTNGAFAEAYAYDALGRRVSTTTIEGTVRHVYDDSWQCIADIDENGNVLRFYIWGDGIDNLLAVKIGNESYYPFTDIQGTVWGFTDSTGAIVARWTYDAWGNVLSEFCAAPAIASVRYRFQGREWSKATDLINFRMRWYDPVTGRWLSKDPIRLGGGLNLYVFCGNIPILYADPRGMVLMISIDPEPEKWGNPTPDWHGKDRDAKNNNLPKTPPEEGSGWIELLPSQSIFHDNKRGKPERKFIHRDGREAVYDGDKETLITDNDYKGTYNYVTPPVRGDNWWSWTWRSVGHGALDVLPYIIWGN